jgi:hypothetical protein
MLPLHIIGTSSTLREMTGLRLAVERWREELRGKKVRFIMDSQPAIRNLMKGGGPVHNLNEAAKEWWKTIQKLNIQPSYEWVRREDNQLADEMSKTNSFKVSKEWVNRDVLIRIEQFCRENGVPTIDFPDYNSIAQYVRGAKRAKAHSGLVVPEFQAMPWWPVLMQGGTRRSLLGTTLEVYTGRTTGGRLPPKWNIWVVECFLTEQGGPTEIRQ